MLYWQCFDFAHESPIIIILPGTISKHTNFNVRNFVLAASSVKARAVVVSYANYENDGIKVVIKNIIYDIIFLIKNNYPTHKCLVCVQSVVSTHDTYKTDICR